MHGTWLIVRRRVAVLRNGRAPADVDHLIRPQIEARAVRAVAALEVANLEAADYQDTLAPRELARIGRLPARDADPEPFSAFFAFTVGADADLIYRDSKLRDRRVLGCLPEFGIGAEVADRCQSEHQLVGRQRGQGRRGSRAFRAAEALTARFHVVQNGAFVGVEVRV